jgi:hypothetical protein
LSFKSRVLRGDRPFEHVVLDQLVEDAGGQRVRGFDRFTAGAHLGGFRHAGEPRQTLRAARTGDEPDLNLRLADLRVRRGDAVVARLRHLQPAAERGAVDGADHRLRVVLQFGE